MIWQEVGRLGVDLIMMAAYGWMGLIHLIHSSVAEEVVRRSSTPVSLLHAS